MTLKTKNWNNWLNVHICFTLRGKVCQPSKQKRVLLFGLFLYYYLMLYCTWTSCRWPAAPPASCCCCCSSWIFSRLIVASCSLIRWLSWPVLSSAAWLSWSAAATRSCICIWRAAMLVRRWELRQSSSVSWSLACCSCCRVLWTCKKKHLLVCVRTFSVSIWDQSGLYCRSNSTLLIREQCVKC